MYDNNDVFLYFNDDDYISHYGVLGMKWGVRNDRSSNKTEKLTDRKVRKEINKIANARTKASLKRGVGSGTAKKQIKAVVDKREKELPGFRKKVIERQNKVQTRKLTAVIFGIPATAFAIANADKIAVGAKATNYIAKNILFTTLVSVTSKRQAAASAAQKGREFAETMGINAPNVIDLASDAYRVVRHEGFDIALNDYDDDYLAHYGVLGMKWGVRKDREKPTNKTKQTIGDTDRIIKSGTKIMNVTDRKFKEGYNNRIYASHTDYDKASYVDIVSSWGDTGNAYVNTFSVKKDIRIPSDKKVVDVFSSLVKENPKAVAKDMAMAYKARVGLPLKSEKHFSKKIQSLNNGDIKTGKKLYKQYNNMLVVDMKSSQNFYAKLAAEGYSALSDTHDRGSVSLDPLIIFKPEGSLSKVESLKLTTEDIKNYNKQVVNTNFRKARKTFNEAHK